MALRLYHHTFLLNFTDMTRSTALDETRQASRERVMAALGKARILIAVMEHAARDQTTSARKGLIRRVNCIVNGSEITCTIRDASLLEMHIDELDEMMGLCLSIIEEEEDYMDYLVGWAEMSNVADWLARMALGRATATQLDQQMEMIMGIAGRIGDGSR